MKPMFERKPYIYTLCLFQVHVCSLRNYASPNEFLTRYGDPVKGTWEW